MPEQPTPGQLAYAAYCLFWCNQGLGERALRAWDTLTPEMHAAWEAAAQAVLAEAMRSVQAVLRAWHVSSPGTDLAEAMQPLETWWAQQQTARKEAPDA